MAISPIFTDACLFILVVSMHQRHSVSSTVSTTRHLNRGRWAYFCYFAAMAGFMPFLTLYYEGLGLSGAQIGLLSGITPVVTFVAAPLWGALADATHQHKRLLLAAIGGALLIIALFLQAHQLAYLIPLVVAYALFTAPIMPLIDNTVLAMLGDQRQRYGRVRLWGALGWGVVGTIGGLVVDWAGVRASFASYFLGMAALWWIAARLPVAPASIGSRFWHGARSLFADPQWTVLLVTIFCSGVALSITHTFLFLHVDALGGSRTLMGFSLTAATLSEIPVFFYADRLLGRWGARGLLIIALIAQVIRMAGYALMPAPWLILPISLLHGLTFSALWTASVAYAGQLAAPKGLMATAQGLLSGVSMGLGGVVGGLMGGLIYEQLGAVALFTTVGGVALAGLLFFLVMGRAAWVRAPVAEG
jgi:MFS transporter, PPP family, 3-phenylpropionic acid transporter